MIVADNGWANYETCVVKLWLDKDEASYHTTRGAWASAEANVNRYTTRSQAARILLTETLLLMVSLQAPALEGVYADLLNAALGEVNWFEIADSLLAAAELDGYEAKDDVTTEAAGSDAGKGELDE